MDNIVVFDHPLIKHKLTVLRKEKTNSKEFRELVNEIAMLMAYEVFRDLPLKDVTIKTPLAETVQKEVVFKPVIVPILRAGLGMVDGILSLVPFAKVGHIGLVRDHDTHEPHEYYCKLPEINDEHVILLDPMLATGGSAEAAVNFIKKRGCKNIKFMSIIAAPEGIKRLHEKHPDIQIYCGCVDEKLNENCYIVPGLGDAGDRLFGTE